MTDPGRDLRQASRREFLRFGTAGLFTALGLPWLESCGGGPAAPGPVSSAPGRPRSNLGNLGPLLGPDPNGVRLPAGFTSRVVARSGRPPVPGAAFLWHRAPDGGATYSVSGGGWIYVSNSEMEPGAGGAGALRFDAAGTVVAAYPILTGTARNCAGGKLSGDRWLSCEENGDGGRVYECDVSGVGPAVARPALGRFNHEGVALDTVENVLYLTEDRPDGGLYRFRPATRTTQGYPDLSAGTLEVAEVIRGGTLGSVAWHALPDPDGARTPTRYQVPAMTPFNGGEGIGYHDGTVYFATKGDNRVWAYKVATAMLVVLYDDDTSSSPILTGVDNVECSSDGDVLVAEDGGDLQIVAITAAGLVVPLLQLVGHDLSEVTGPAFSPDQRRLYFSSQRGTTGSSSDGMTFEIMGPFFV
jgi:uncharacterized protein